MGKQSVKPPQRKGQIQGQAPARGKEQGQRQRQGQPQAQRSPATAKTNAEVLAAQEAKRETRMQRQSAARAAAEQRRRMRLLRNIAIIVAVTVLVVGGITAYFVNEAGKPGQAVAQQASNHIQAATDAHAPYDSDPPTSGPHTKDVPSWGVHTEPVAKELQVHALEDAGVIISYRPDLDKATVDLLKTLTESYDKDVLMAPYQGLSDPIVLTAWTRMDRLEAFDEARIKRFISAYKGLDHHKDSGT